MSQNQFKGISNRGRYLLGIQENNEVDFKESLAGLSSDDLVAFANSEGGGAILIGVREAKDDKGMQTSIIVGCSVGDEAKMSILNRASSCVPRIPVDVFVENLGDRPFLRIEIPEGPSRPHCSSSGTYKTRDDGQNVGIHPRALLAMFVEKEGDRFFNRFHDATANLQAEIQALREELVEQRKETGG